MQISSMKMDKAAIGLSFACVVHCLLTPIAIVMLPALGSTFLKEEMFHYGILFLVLPTSLFALGLGCRKHKRLEILLIGLLFLVLILGEEAIGETGEKITTVAGTAIVGFAHLRNFRLCQSADCHVSQPGNE
jgi:hypothetical protein